MVISAPGVIQEALDVSDWESEVSWLGPAASSNYPTIFRLFESERSTWHQRDDQSGWNWSCEWQEKSDETRARPTRVRGVTTASTSCPSLAQTHRPGETPDILREYLTLRERRNKNWTKHGEMWRLPSLVWGYGKQYEPIVIKKQGYIHNGDWSRDSVLDLWSTEVGLRHQQEHDVSGGAYLSISVSLRASQKNGMGWCKNVSVVN